MAFNGNRLRILRRFHNLTQRDLAAKIGSPTTAITGYERGHKEPKGIILDALCAALSVEPEFFSPAKADDEFLEHETNFRSLVKTPDRLKKQVLAHATLFGALLELLSTKAKLPKARLPKFQVSNPGEIEHAAEQCRIEWGVGADAPIHNVTLMLEHAGIVVTVLDKEVSRQVDAFSRYGATNLIVLNPAKGSATRARMDMAHEAGHGVLHQSGFPLPFDLREDQAKYFASALLLPQRAFASEFCALTRRDWSSLFDLKSRWGASVAAIIVRAYHLGLIDAAEYRRLYRELSRQGWLRLEPHEPEAESPQLFSLLLKRYQAETGKTTREIADELRWSPELFKLITGMDAVEHTPTLESAVGLGVSSLEAHRIKKLANG